MFLEALSQIYNNGKHDFKDRTKVDQLLRDIEAYEATHSGEVNEEMTTGEFMKFLSKLDTEATSLLLGSKT